MRVLNIFRKYDVENNKIIESLTIDKENFKNKLNMNDDDLYSGFTGIWGLCFKDISSLDLSDFTAQQLSRIPFSTLTIFPEKSKLPKGYNSKELIQNGLSSKPKTIRDLHNIGVNGKGITIAVIDKPHPLNHVDFQNVDIEVVDRGIKYKDDDIEFHGLCVLSALCGKNNGIVTKSKILFYPAQGADTEDKFSYTISTFNEKLKCLEDILKKLQSGFKIDIVSMSTSFWSCRPVDKKDVESLEEKRYKEIRKELLKYGCTVITSDEFWNYNYNYAYKKNNFINVDDYDNYDESRLEGEKRMNVLCGGKCYPLIDTVEEYMYDATGSASWAIPIVSGIFALAKQIKNNLTFEQFTKIAWETSFSNKSGVRFINPFELCMRLQKEMIKNEKTRVK